MVHFHSSDCRCSDCRPCGPGEKRLPRGAGFLLAMLAVAVLAILVIGQAA